MKKALLISLILIGMVLTPALFGATPTPSPVPSPSPAGAFTYPRHVELYADFTTATDDAPLIKAADHLYFTTINARNFYITAIGWSAQSAVNARLEWDTTPNDRLGLPVNFTATGQGYTFTTFYPPLTSDVMGASPTYTVDADSTGTVWINGYME